MSCKHCEHSHEHEHEAHEHEESNIKVLIVRILICVALAVVAHFVKNQIASKIFFIASYFVIAYDILLRSLKNISHGEIFDENFLMAVASIGALSINEMVEAVAVMLLYQIGEACQDYAADKSRDSISSLLDIRPDQARIIRDGVASVIKPEEVAIGDILLVKPGERIPIDGKVVEGNSFVDTSSVTGESVPVEVSIDSKVFSGTINNSGVIKIVAEKLFAESTAVRIMELVENASEKKAPAENFISRFAHIYTPIVVFLALAIGILSPLVLHFATGIEITKSLYFSWIHRALIFLVVSCPCALVISVPLGFFAGLGCASKNGILVKGGNYLDSLARTKIAVFDKTGTLTKGTFEVSLVHPVEGILENDLVTIAAHAEMFSNHPVAQSLRKAHTADSSLKISCCENCVVTDVTEIAGKGISVKVDDKVVYAGNEKLMTHFSVEGFDANHKCEKCNQAGSTIHIAVDGKYLGHILISDEIKNESQQTLKELKNIGVQKNVMLTGDAKVSAEKVASLLGIDEVHAGLLPGDKVDCVEKLLAEKNASSDVGTLIFTGDGINDAPVLARADVGIAMGAMGSDAAIEAADVVIMTDEVSKIPLAIRIARKTNKIVKQNIVFALGVKITVLILAALNYGNLWLAVFADVGVCLLAILNSIRASKV